MAVSTIDALYHSGSEKLTTTSDGVNIQGAITSQSPNSGVLLEEYAADAFGANFTMRKSRNATIGGQTAVASGDTLGNITFQGSDGDEFVSGASIQSFVDGTPGNNDMPGNLVFKTTPDGSSTLTERLRITSAGNVGVGTSSPSSSYKVTIDNDESMIRMNHTGTGTNGNLDLAVNSTVATINANYSTTAIDLRFLTGAQERMRIDSSGNVLMGKTSASIDVDGVMAHNGGYINATNTGGSAAYFNRKSSDGDIVNFQNDGSSVGSISVSGSSTAYNTSSDYRLKENVVDLTGASARVNQLNPSRFNFISDADKTVDGFLAHEVATVVPEAITGTKDAMMDEEYEVTPAVLDDDGNVTTEAVMGTRSVPDYQGIDQSKLVPLLTAALQEALTEIASLKTRVEALEA